MLGVEIMYASEAFVEGMMTNWKERRRISKSTRKIKRRLKKSLPSGTKVKKIGHGQLGVYGAQYTMTIGRKKVEAAKQKKTKAAKKKE